MRSFVSRRGSFLQANDITINPFSLGCQLHIINLTSQAAQVLLLLLQIALVDV